MAPHGVRQHEVVDDLPDGPGGDGDDGAAAPVGDGRVGRPDRPDHAHHEEVVGVVPVLVGHLEERARRRAAGAGDDVVEAVERLDGLADEALEFVWVGDVRADGEHLAVAGRLQAGLRTGEAVRIAATDRDVTPRPGEHRRAGQSEAGRARRDQSRVALESEVHTGASRPGAVSPSSNGRLDDGRNVTPGRGRCRRP